jgi:predicted ATPase
MQHLEQAWALFDAERDAESGFTYGQDLGVSALSYLCLGSVLSGFPERARKLGHEAVARGRDVAHVNTLAYALLHAALAAYIARDRPTMEQHGSQLQPLLDEHSLPVWEASGSPLAGAILGWQGRPEDGLGTVDQGIEMMAGLQFKLFQPIWSLIRAELLTNLGPTEDALAAITDGLDVTSATGERWGDAELHRVRGELLASMSQDSEAEAAFTTALTIAREQGAKWWELRTATSLAKLWSEQKKQADAQELLSSIYGWFTEGFDTADLVAARQLLDELSGVASRPATTAA